MRLSEKHGVNPSLDVCFWCNGPRGVLLYGALPKDAEAPKQTLVDYEPCDQCKAIMGTGILFVTASQTPNVEGQQPMRNGLYPCGDWYVVSRGAVEALVAKALSRSDLQLAVLLESAIAGGGCFIHPLMVTLFGFDKAEVEAVEGQ